MHSVNIQTRLYLNMVDTALLKVWIDRWCPLAWWHAYISMHYSAVRFSPQYKMTEPGDSCATIFDR